MTPAHQLLCEPLRSPVGRSSRASATAAGGLLVSLYLDRPLSAQEHPKRSRRSIRRMPSSTSGLTARSSSRSTGSSSARASTPPCRCCWPTRWTPTGRRSSQSSRLRPTSTRIRSEACRWSAGRDRSPPRSSSTASWARGLAPCSSRPPQSDGRSRRTSAARKPVSSMAQPDKPPGMRSWPATPREVPVPATVRLKNPADFRLVGKRVRRLDSRPKCDGSQKFGLDLDLPGHEGGAGRASSGLRRRDRRAWTTRRRAASRASPMSSRFRP